MIPQLLYCRPAICIFYLVLRALDTVEDDMTIPTGEKVKMLRYVYKQRCVSLSIMYNYSFNIIIIFKFTFVSLYYGFPVMNLISKLLVHNTINYSHIYIYIYIYSCRYIY